ncbi:hypothetical protein CYQ88_11390 [Hydrogenovibrio sp. SC-1]|uniref:EAL domain-containing protein n=1 Tax=Hydrogenovibrio sp. SC-1 TaxID=2065820 RepID=UPI000C7A1194|nr:EAL domain-containing protein [Hydrogenovibrio sp. SC-1]PLA73407.1 hypothetical protein CYQ88_11390 [Hydrogenovibrio sp. SC-1]
MTSKSTSEHYDLKALSYVFDNARVGLALCRAQDNCLEMVNPAFARMHGYQVDELMGLSPSEVFAPEFMERLSDCEKINLECAKNDMAFETEHLRKDGSSFPVYVHITVIKDANNKVQHRIASVQDISDRYSLQQLNETKDQLLSSILESSPDIVTFAIDTEYQYLAFNHQHQVIMNNRWGQNIRIGQSIFEVINSRDDADQAKACFDRAMKGESFSIEQCYGDVVHYERQYWQIFYSPILDAQGQVSGVSCFNLNITQKKQSDRLMRVLLSAINSSSESVFLIDIPTASFLYVNQTASDTLGYSKEELLNGMTVWDIDPNTCEQGGFEYIEFLRDQYDQCFESLHKSKAGKVYPVEVKVHHILFEDAEYNLAITQDISERKHNERMNLQSHENYKHLSENSTDVVIRYNLKLEIIYVNPVVELIIGVDKTQLLGRRLGQSNILSSESTNQLKTLVTQVIATGEVAEFESIYYTDKLVFAGNEKIIPKAIQLADSACWSYNKLIPEYDDQGEIISVLFIGRDITELKHTQESLEKKERDFRTLVESTPDTICRYDMDCKRVYANPAMMNLVPSHVNILGSTPTDVCESPGTRAYEASIIEVFETGKASVIDVEWRTSRGNTIISQIHIVPEIDEQGNVITVLAVGRDIKQQKQYENKIKYIANYDVLTGLLSRNHVQELSQLLMEEADQSGRQVAFVFIDLDGFKSVNDTLGHAMGDILLKKVANRLNTKTREHDLLSRQGGDEFLMVLPDISSETAVVDRIVDLQKALDVPIVVNDFDLRVSMSVGIAFYPTHGQTFDELLKKSDMAMYWSKDTGKNTCTVYSEEIDNHSIEKLIMQNEIKLSLERNEFELYYQPQVDIVSGKMVGAEALVRWNHPEKGMIRPDEFISIAELSGSILSLGEWVIREACRQIACWQEQGIYLNIAVNVSAVQFKKSNLDVIVSDALQQSNIDAKWLELEITESGMMYDSEKTLELTQQLSLMGVRIAIDDFGTGYSSLAHIKRFSIDKLKIDKCFITNILLDNDDYRIVQAIIHMAKSLKLEIIAEGVESNEALSLLQSMGCKLAQGFHFSEPVPVGNFEQLFNEH